jgi:hypothetical protein
MAFETKSDSRMPAATHHAVSSDEFQRLGERAARQRPAHETRKYQIDTSVPRDAKLGFAIGGALLLVCLVALVGRAIASRPSAQGGGATAPAIKSAPQGN